MSDTVRCKICGNQLSETRAWLGLTVCSGPCHKAAFNTGGTMQITCPTCGADFTDRPDHLPNHVYYKHEMVTKRVRIVVDADVEWREDDPAYSLDAAMVDIPSAMASIRVKNVTPHDAEFLDIVRFPVAGPS